ncbi:MAG: V-type ATP synthase subunit E family protein [Candidatus Omnitrophota bacterium]
MMAQEIKDLIAKIQSEGVTIAQERAREIEDKAKEQAQKIIAAARLEAQRIISDARKEQEEIKLSTESACSQAGRDFLITLRSRINGLLDRLVQENIRQILTAEELSGVILSLVKTAAAKTGQIVITLNENDRALLEKAFLHKLIEEVKSGIVLKSSDEISAGFRISFDAGKSHFDFTDVSLAEYISAKIRPELSRIFKNVE